MARSSSSRLWRLFGRGGWFMASPVLLALLVVVVATVQVHAALEREALEDGNHARAEEVRRAGDSLLADLVDAETGQRGYLLTGGTDFLEPYRRSLATVPNGLDRLTAAVDSHDEERLRRIELHVSDKLTELATTIAVHTTEGPEAARERVALGQGKQIMDALRLEVDLLVSDADERARVLSTEAARERERAVRIGTVAVGVVVVALLAMLGLLRQRGRWERERTDMLAELEALASRDPLTGLLNRRMLEDRLDHALSRAARQRTDVALAFVDLDGFKPVNDALGHHRGDAVLAQVARNLTGAVRDSDTVARVGGDEFVVMVEDFPGDRSAASILERLHEASTAVVSASGAAGTDLELRVTGSIGLVTLRELDPGFDGSDVEAAASHLMAVADQRMYDAKPARGGRSAADRVPQA